MVKTVDLNDFRAVRRILEPQDFALSDGKKDSPPTDLITEEAWHAVMTLPSDVAHRTTSHQGSRVELLHEVTSAWIEVCPDQGMISSAMLDAYDAFQAATFTQVHGFYKEAITALRAALEMITLAAACELNDDMAAWERWLAGDELRFKHLCDQLQSFLPLTMLEQKARAANGSGIFSGNSGNGRVAWARSIYARLSHYSHARSTSSNAELWKSNGPIYSAEGFRLAYSLFLETHALCLLLAKVANPAIPQSETAQLVLRSDSLQLYLDEPYRAVCKFYVSELF
jgi:hypothetical protein